MPKVDDGGTKLSTFGSYMSTTGAPHLSLASDLVSTPPEFLPFYSEKVSNLAFRSKWCPSILKGQQCLPFYSEEVSNRPFHSEWCASILKG